MRPDVVIGVGPLLQLPVMAVEVKVDVHDLVGLLPIGAIRTLDMSAELRATEGSQTG